MINSLSLKIKRTNAVIKIKFLVFLLAFFCINKVYSQNDSKIEFYLDSASILQESIPSKALEHAFEAQRLAKIEKNNNLISESHQKIATIYRILGNLIEAEKHINTAISFPISDKHKLVETYITKGIILKQLCRFDESLDCYKATLLIQQSEGDLEGEGRTYNNIGRIYEAMELYPKALTYYRKAFRIYSNLPISKGTGLIRQNIGHIHRFNNSIDSAVFYYNLALSIYKEVDNPILIAYAYRSLASVANDKVLAIEYLNKSIVILEKANITADAMSYTELSEIYFKNKEYKKTISLLKEGVELFTNSLYKNVTRDALKLLYSSYDSVGDYKNALYFQALYFQYQDSIKSENNMFAMQEYESNIKLKERENENAIQQIEIQNTNEKLLFEQQQRIYFSFGIAILFILLIIVVIQVFKQKKNNETLHLQKNEIEKKDKEKEVLIREIHHRVKNNLQIISSLLKLDQRNTENMEAKETLLKSSQRIEAIAFIHEKLYQQKGLGNIDLEDYLIDISENLLLSFDKFDKINLKIKSRVHNLHADIAINIGMLVTELITNSIKHGYINEPQKFKINLTITDESGLISFDYSDNGDIIVDFENREYSKSFGISLIKSIIKKLNGEIVQKDKKTRGFELLFNFRLHNYD
jgi:two-component sensor histidine kinase